MLSFFKRKKKTVQYEVKSIKGTHAMVETNHGVVRKEVRNVDPILLRAYRKKYPNDR